MRNFMKFPVPDFNYRLWVDVLPDATCLCSRSILVKEEPVKGSDIAAICQQFRAEHPELNIEFFFGPSLPYGNERFFPF